MKNIRQQQILDWLASHGHAALRDLTQVASARRLTIQRDLVELERAGQLKRIRGGAVSLDQRWLARPHEQRIQENRAEKKQIAELAAKPLAPFECIGLDGSTTCLNLAPGLGRGAGETPRTILATSIDTFAALRSVAGVRPMLSGGMLHNIDAGSAGTLVGSLTIQAIKSLRFDAVCLSTMAFDPVQGVYDSNWDDVSIKQALISVAERVFLLIDHTKWSAPRGVKVCEASAIHTIITDRHPGVAAIKALPESVTLICGAVN